MSDSPVIQPPSASPPAQVRENITCTQPLTATFSASAPLVSNKEGNDLPHTSRVLMIMDCKNTGRVPSIHEALSLMDHERPSANLRYIDALSELQDFGKEDAVEMYSLGVEHLATFRYMGVEEATRLSDYTRDKLLAPLGLMKTGVSEPSVEEVAAPGQAANGGVGKVDEATENDTIEEIEEDKAAQEEIEDADGYMSDGVVMRWLERANYCDDAIPVEYEYESTDESEGDEGEDEGNEEEDEEEGSEGGYVSEEI